MKITLEILKILIYFFLQNIKAWDALSFNSDNTDIYFDLTWPLRGPLDPDELRPPNFMSTLFKVLDF